MPRVSLELRQIPFLTERGVSVPAARLFVHASFLSPQGRRVPYPTLIDTGAAYSVVPYRLARQIGWSNLGAHLILANQSRPVAWLGVAAEMGELEVELVDARFAVRSASLRVVAKVVSQPVSPHLDAFAVLGMSFFLDNQALLEVDATGATFSSSLWIP